MFDVVIAIGDGVIFVVVVVIVVFVIVVVGIVVVVFLNALCLSHYSCASSTSARLLLQLLSYIITILLVFQILLLRIVLIHSKISTTLFSDVLRWRKIFFYQNLPLFYF